MFVKSYEEIVGNATESADFYEAEMLMAVWETTPEAVDKLLPAPLKPVEITAGSCFRRQLSIHKFQRALF